jgi:dynein heavy chain
VETINNIYDIRVPKTWLLDATGSVEISWITPTLGSWLKGLIDRHYQLHNWLNKGRPPSFWLTGFYNQQGFLTAAQQEITRQNAESNWSLDSVKQWYEPQKEVIQGEDGRIEKAITAPAEGVLIHGLYLEGAAWSKGRLEESSGKELFQAFPIVLVTAISLNTDNAGPRHAVGKKADPLALAANYYDCVVYKYPKRSDKYLVTRMLLKPDSSTQGEKGKNAGAQDNVLPVGMTPKINWKLKGVALLCTKE